MSAEVLQDLARTAEDTAREVPGVACLFRPGTLLGNVMAVIADAATGATGAPLVDVSLREDRLHLTIAIGVSVAAAETGRAVHDALRRAMAEAGHPDAVVHLTVAQIAA